MTLSKGGSLISTFQLCLHEYIFCYLGIIQLGANQVEPLLLLVISASYYQCIPTQSQLRVSQESEHQYTDVVLGAVLQGEVYQ